MDKNPFQYNNLVATSGDVATAATSVGQVPWLALADRGYVTVRPPALTTINQTYLGPWWVAGPNGEQIDTTGTTTQGLQEAVNYAVTHGYQLKVVGQGGRSNGNGSDATTLPPVLFCSTPITFPPMFLQDIDFGNISIIFTNATSGLIFDSCMMVRFKMNGQAIVSGSNPGVVFRPHTTLPIDPKTTITASRFEFGSIGATSGGGALSSLCTFNCDSASIVGNYFSFLEMEGINAFDNAITIKNCGNVGGTTVFLQNEISTPNIHGCTSSGILIGGSTVGGLFYGNNYRGNIFRIAGIRGGGASAAGIQCFGNLNTFIGGEINGQEGGLDKGIIITSTADASGNGGRQNTFLGWSVQDNTGLAYTDGSGTNFKFGGNI